VEQFITSVTSMDLGMIFQVLFFVGVIFMVVTAFLGIGSDADVDSDIDSDLDYDASGPDFISIKMVAAYLTGFGGGGWIAYDEYNQTLLISMISGFFGAIVVGIISYYIIKLFLSQQTGSGIAKTSDFIGCSGVISTSIPQGEGKVGQILCTIKHSQKYYTAMSHDGKEINKETEVIIAEMIEGKAIVKKKKSTLKIIGEILTAPYSYFRKNSIKPISSKSKKHSELPSR